MVLTSGMCKLFEQFSWKPRELCAGMTLVETVVAMCLLGLFLAGACQLVVATGRTCDRARVRYTAISLAKNRLERVSLFPFDQVELCAHGALVMNRHGVPTYRGDYRLSTKVSTYGPHLKEVVVTVDILNRRTYCFDGETQEIATLVARKKVALDEY